MRLPRCKAIAPGCLRLGFLRWPRCSSSPTSFFRMKCSPWGTWDSPAKCLNTVRELVATSAVIFVSHNMQLVSTFCTDIMVLRNGRVHTFTPDIGKGVRAYMDAFDTSSSVSGTRRGSSVENVRLLRRWRTPLTVRTPWWRWPTGNPWTSALT